jgi:hypothetical protein
MIRLLRGRRLAATVLTALACALAPAGSGPAQAADAPAPLLGKDRPVKWWFVYKFNSQTFDQCGPDEDTEDRACPFGGKPGGYRNTQQFVFASSDKSSFTKSDGCAGTADPVAATFDQIYSGKFRYVVWNDQFYQEPRVHACSGNSCPSPWGHSKGILAWNDEGEGVIVQVTTPVWPGIAAKKFKRKSGNTLGCIVKPNNIKNAQHFFALQLSRKDVVSVLDALKNASVVTDTERLELVNNGGPEDISSKVEELGVKDDSGELKEFQLESGALLFSKPSGLHVPPWQMLSSALGSVDLKAATWWAFPQIPTTTSSKKIACWDDSLTKKPGAVEIAVTGQWDGTEIGLVGGQNHGKIGVSTSGSKTLSIFADLNQQGALKGKCASSQNGRGGLFFVLNDPDLFKDMTTLLDGEVASTVAPKKIIKVKDE